MLYLLHIILLLLVEKALRVLNEMSSTQDMLYKNESKNMVKSYCENYDKAKKMVIL